MVNVQTKEWLKAGYADLRSISHIINDDFLTHIVAFHSQQAIEKTLKAILENENKRIPRVHKLENLISRVDFNLKVDEEIIEILDELYIDSRYPSDMGLLPYGKPTLEDAKKFYDTAKNIFDEVCSIFQISENDLKS